MWRRRGLSVETQRRVWELIQWLFHSTVPRTKLPKLGELSWWRAYASEIESRATDYECTVPCSVPCSTRGEERGAQWEPCRRTILLFPKSKRRIDTHRHRRIVAMAAPSAPALCSSTISNMKCTMTRAVRRTAEKEKERDKHTHVRREY